jgi:molybdopterin synthase catalytic subunit
MRLVRIRVVAFASASEALGATEREMILDRGTDVGSLRELLAERHPALELLWPRLAVAVDGEPATAETRLEDGSEVALLPPVSGGADQPIAALTDSAIDAAELVREVAAASCGAVLLFLGTVRDHHGGRRVERLTYHAYRSMAQSTLSRLVSELETESPGCRVGIVHRLGEVPIGEASVAIAVAAPHRERAYQLSRRALERLKREVPIWKRELYSDGELAWREEESLVPAAD